MQIIQSEWRCNSHDGTRVRRHAVIASADGGAVEVDEDFVTPGLPPSISYLWVTPAFRKRGIASKLMDAAEQLCREWGYSKCRLGYDERDSPAWVARWYERRGYDDIKTNGGPPGRWAALYEKRLE